MFGKYKHYLTPFLVLQIAQLQNKQNKCTLSVKTYALAEKTIKISSLNAIFYLFLKLVEINGIFSDSIYINTIKTSYLEGTVVAVIVL